MAEYIERTEELMLAMNAGARAIENTKRYHGAIYNKDLFSDNPQEIPYLLAAKVLREVSDAPAADVAPVVHGQWIIGVDNDDFDIKCPKCEWTDIFEVAGIAAVERIAKAMHYCPNCGAKMDEVIE